MYDVLVHKVGKFMFTYIITKNDVHFVPALKTSNGYVCCALIHEVQSRKDTYAFVS